MRSSPFSSSKGQKMPFVLSQISVVHSPNIPPALISYDISKWPNHTIVHEISLVYSVEWADASKWRENTNSNAGSFPALFSKWRTLRKLKIWLNILCNLAFYWQVVLLFDKVLKWVCFCFQLEALLKRKAPEEQKLKEEVEERVQVLNNRRSLFIKYMKS